MQIKKDNIDINVMYMSKRVGPQVLTTLTLTLTTLITALPLM